MVLRSSFLSQQDKACCCLDVIARTEVVLKDRVSSGTHHTIAAIQLLGILPLLIEATSRNASFCQAVTLAGHSWGNVEQGPGPRPRPDHEVSHSPTLVRSMRSRLQLLDFQTFQARMIERLYPSTRSSAHGLSLSSHVRDNSWWESISPGIMSPGHPKASCPISTKKREGLLRYAGWCTPASPSAYLVLS